MKPSPEQAELIRRVERARRTLDQAERNARQAIDAAFNGGLPRTRIADAFGVARSTLWRREQSNDNVKSRA